MNYDKGWRQFLMLVGAEAAFKIRMGRNNPWVRMNGRSAKGYRANRQWAQSMKCAAQGRFL
jgi:hypothetical protein